jgi:cysteine-rich repeat protein
MLRTRSRVGVRLALAFVFCTATAGTSGAQLVTPAPNLEVAYSALPPPPEPHLWRVGPRFGRELAIGDFDGNYVDDVVVGAPNGNVKLTSGVQWDQSGYVQVIYGEYQHGLDLTNVDFWDQEVYGVSGAAEDGDRFGSALATGDFDNDGRDDLAIGVPNEDLGSLADAGAVHVLYGSSSGLTTSGEQLWTQDSSGVLGVAEAGDQFGYALAAGDFDGDNYDDLAIGVPGQVLNGYSGAGTIHVLFGSASGLTATDNQYLGQDLPNVAGGAAQGDQFGYALAAGRLNGDSKDDLAVGVPGDNVNTISSGAVHVFYGDTPGLSTATDELWHLNVTGMNGSPATLDYFGASLAIGDFNDDTIGDLAVGMPNKDVAGQDGAGALQVIYGSSGGLTATGNLHLNQQLAAIPGVPEVNDGFATGLAAGDLDGDGYDELAVGTPADGVSTPAGTVALLRGTASGITTTGVELVTNHVQFGGAIAMGQLGTDGPRDLVVGESLQVFYTGCGNGVIDAGEACDDGNFVDTDSCTVCAVAVCGDGTAQSGIGEQCDDGGTVSGDGCSDICQNEYCGDGIVQAGIGEECEDYNSVNGDGCFAFCRLEVDWLRLYGTAAGGSVSVTIEGVLVTVLTFAGQSVDEVFASLVIAIEADPTLMALGVRAGTDPIRLLTTHEITDLTIDDAGLSTFPPPLAGVPLPGLGAVALSLLGAAIAGVGWVEARRRR